MVANKDFQQAVNKILIRRAVLAAGSSTRASLARELGMYRSTVSNLTEVLLEEKWLREEGASTAAGAGRKGTILAINPGKGLVAGVALRRHGLFDIIFTDPAGREIAVRQEKIRNPEQAERLDYVLSEVLNRIDKEAGDLDIPVLGVGISISGPVDSARQQIVRSEQFNLENADFTACLPERDYPVLVENDSRCCTWAKNWQTGNQCEENFVYLYLNRQEREADPEFTIGLGLFLNGKAHQGAHQFAGELPPVYSRNLHRDFPERTGLILKNQSSGDNRNRKRLVDAADSLMDMIQFLDPEKLYLGHHMEEFRAVIETYLESRGIEILFDVEFAGLGAHETALGAACYLLNSLYALPVAGPRK